MKLVVPTSFKVLSHKGKVVRLCREDLDKKAKDLCPRTKDSTVGLYDHQTHTIYLVDTLKGTELIQCYLHELIHCILYSTGQDGLSEDEDFVDLFSEVLLQILSSQKGKLENVQIND